MVLLHFSICYFLGLTLFFISALCFRISDKLFFYLLFSSVAAFFLYSLLIAVGFKLTPLLPFNGTIVGYFGLIGLFAVIIINLIV